jgi:lysophospholipase L1-like esterase
MCAWLSTDAVVYENNEEEDEESKIEEILQPWKGKEWYCYGTSMTDESYNGYAPKLATLSGMNMHNFGKGGSGIIPSLHDSDNIKTRCMRTSDGKTNADLITVEVIPNDMSGTLGEPTDTSNDTFLGNLNQIIQYLFENCPKAQIVILNATRARYQYQQTSTTFPPESATVTKWLQWEDGVKEVCRRHSIQYWNGASECGLGYHRMKSATSGNTYVKDQIHLTDVGAENLAYFFNSKLKQLPQWHTTYDLG